MNAPSARGLFRATGKKSKPVVQRNLDGSYERVENLEREANEFYPTPVEPIRSFIMAELSRLADFNKIWGPACGEGVIGRELRGLGFDTHDSDIIDRGCQAEIKSFYDYKTAPTLAIVENPPYADCNERDGKAKWIWHAMDTLGVEYMALLLNWSWPGAGGHAGLWSKYPPARVYLMRWKIDFTGQGAPPMLNAWFVWDKKHQGETVLRMLDRNADARQSTLFSEVAA